MINQEKVFVPYEIAKELKEIGCNFDTGFYYENKEICFDAETYMSHDNAGRSILIYYELSDIEIPNPSNVVLAPTYEQAFEWFREKGYFVTVMDEYAKIDDTNILAGYSYRIIKDGEIVKYTDPFNASYEEVQNMCITEVIKIIKPLL